MAAILHFQLFKVYKHLVCAVSTRQYGSINENGIVFHNNLHDFAHDIDIDPSQVVLTKQVHGKKVIQVQNTDRQVIGEADGLVTNQKNVILAVATADCLPVVFYDPKKEIVGVAHAGYKGLLAGVLENMLKEFKKMNSNPKDLLIGIGPAIQACCYTVKPERIQQFKDKFPNLETFYYEEGQPHLDLPQVAKFILLNNNVLADNIEDSGICTSDANEMFFSFRKDTKETFGEFVTLIGLL